MSMNDESYTALAYLAQAIVAQPELADEFTEAVKEDVQEASSPNVLDESELLQVVEVIDQAWRERRAHKLAQGDPVDFADIVEVARALARESDADEHRRIASLALVSAAQDFLSRKLREEGLSSDERDVAQQLPDIVPQTTLAAG